MSNLFKYSLSTRSSDLVYPSTLLSNAKGDTNNSSYMVFRIHENLGYDEDDKGNVKAKNDKKTNIKRTIRLPFGGALVTEQRMKWSESELGTAGDLSKGNIMDAMQNSSDVIQKVVKGALTGLLGGDGKGAAEFEDKAILNDKLELLFKGINYRTFSFEYTFIPKNKDEATTIRAICDSFKQFSAPKKVGNYFTYPAHLEIVAVSGGKEHRTFKKSVITAANITENAHGQWSTLPDGSPVQTTLVLTVQETELLTFDDFNTGKY